MRYRLLPLLTANALVGAACSGAEETTVTALGESERADEIVETFEPDVPLVIEPPENLEEPVTTLPPQEPLIADVPPVMPGEDTPWQDRPLANTVITLDDLPDLGLATGWEAYEIEWRSIDGQASDALLCGVPVPQERSHLRSQFLNVDSLSTLEVVHMAATTDGRAEASEFIAALERLVTCTDLEEEFASVSMDRIDIDVEGAEDSIVIAGVNTEQFGGEAVTLAAAVVDGHLFLAYVTRIGEPAALDADAEIAVAALELSISRL